MPENCEKIEKTYFELVNLIKRDLSRDPSLALEPENEKIRKKIIEGQQGTVNT